jgi:hypothetical protein
LLLTNRPARTNFLGAALDLTRSALLPFRTPAPLLTNTAQAKPGFIAELCVPGEAEVARRTISEVVTSLKEQQLFSKVDLLSDDLRRSLADPKVLVPDRQFVLALDFSGTDFQQPLLLKKPASVARPKRGRPGLSAPDTADSVTQSGP